MTTTVSDERIREIISEECDRIKELLLVKNRKYGNSALRPVRIFSKASTEEQFRVRLDDKLSRIISSQDDEDEDPNDDIIGYLILWNVWDRLQEEEGNHG